MVTRSDTPVYNSLTDLQKLAAECCHEANRRYCQLLGDDSQRPWDICPDWQKESVARGVLLGWEGGLTPGATHQAWYEQKVEDGWHYGPVKDEVRKTHPSMVPFKELPPQDQFKDFLFFSTIHAVKERADRHIL